MKTLILLTSLTLLLAGCDPFQSTSEHLNILKVEFDNAGLGIDSIYHPTVPGIPGVPGISLPKATAVSRSDFGFRFSWKLKAKNPNSDRAAFAGARALLSVNNQDSSLTANIPAFSLDGGDSTTITIRFPFSLANPLLWDNGLYADILAGDSIPYKLTGAMDFHLVAPVTGDTVGHKTMELDLIESSVPTRPNSFSLTAFTTAIKYFL